MTKNIGTFDRILRLTIGIILIVLAFTTGATLWLKILLVIFTLFCFYEALASWCLFYQLIGRNTCPMQ